MKQLIFMRHGQSEANAQGVYAGNSPHIQLTQLGREQASAAGRELAGHKVDTIVASPLDRARDTALIVAAQIAYPESKIITDERLHEVNVGKLVGQPDLGFIEYLQLAQAHTNPTAETPVEVLERVTLFLKDIAVQYPDQAVLVVAHAGVARAFSALLTGVALETIAGTNIPNARPFGLPLKYLRELRP